jgi:hypothetical protein
LRAAKAAHLPCQVYEGKKKKIGLKMTVTSMKKSTVCRALPQLRRGTYAC